MHTGADIWTTFMCYIFVCPKSEQLQQICLHANVVVSISFQWLPSCTWGFIFTSLGLALTGAWECWLLQESCVVKIFVHVYTINRAGHNPILSYEAQAKRRLLALLGLHN